MDFSMVKIGPYFHKSIKRAIKLYSSQNKTKIGDLYFQFYSFDTNEFVW